MNIRIGNTFNIKFAITKAGEPYDLNDKDLILIMTNKVKRSEIVVEEYTIIGDNNNVLYWTFEGKDQIDRGQYILTLYENHGQLDMMTVDCCDAFNLVARSCEEDGQSTCGNVEVEVVEVTADFREKGEKGDKGDDGDSAYQVAVKNGFTGTEQEWLDSLIGSDGQDGQDGAIGKSAYQSALDNGFVGTEAQWLDYLRQPAEDAAAAANTAATSATNAASDAEDAAAAANTAATSATNATSDAEDAAAAANTAATNAQNVADTYASQLANKVDKVEGKDLSSNDYTTQEKNKLAEIEAGAQKNVQSDYSVDDPDDDAYIKNKVTKVSQLENDQQFVKQSDLDVELNEIRDILNNALISFYYDQWYGVMRTKESGDNELIRIGNFNLHRDLPLQNKLKRFIANPDGTVKYYLHPNDSRLKEDGTPAIIDSTDGNVMLEVPEHYVYHMERGSEMIYAISEHNIPGFVKVPRRVISAFMPTIDNINDKVVSGCFLTWNGNEIARDANNLPIFADNAPQFRGGGNNADRDGTVQSDLGMCRTAIAKNTMRSKCVGTSHLGGFRAYNTIRWFQRIEYANTNCQLAFNPELTAEGFKQGGLGNTTYFSGAEWGAHNGYYPFIPNGVTAVLGNNSGLVDYELQMASGTKLFKAHSYRGFELPYGYIWQHFDDLLAYKIGLLFNRAYVCDDPTKFTSPADTQTEVPDGYVLRGTLPLEPCYPLYEKVDPETGLSFPFIAGGSNTTGMCDYYYCRGEDANGWYTALVGGGGSDGTSAGFGCLYTYYRSSGTIANIGFRLCHD